jgi:hypothetical protein
MEVTNNLSKFAIHQFVLNMKTFLRRLKYYAVGFTIGTLFVYFFFENRGCSWLPDNRVKTAILERVVVVKSDNINSLKKLGVTTENFTNFIKGAEIIFKKSATKKETKAYYIKNNDKSLCVLLPKNSFIAELTDVSGTVFSKKVSSNGVGKFIYFPKQDEFLYADTNKLLTCKQQEINWINNDEILSKIKRNGVFDFEKSNLTKGSQKTQYIVYKDSKYGEIGLKSIWYKEKIDVIQIDLPFESKCLK